MNELEQKLSLLRQQLTKHRLSAFRLRGSDWFAWCLGGASNAVLLSSETGVAEVFVTTRDAYVLTDNIEADRFLHEEVQKPYLLWSAPWQDLTARESFVHDHRRGGTVASDRPRGYEQALPDEVWMMRRTLLPEELTRYRQLGRDAAKAMSEALADAKPEWTEFQLAGRGAQALWSRGIHPALTLVGGARRFPIYRHATPSSEPLGERAMLVFCGRRHGLFANLTRFVYFRRPTEAEQRLKEDVAAVEAAAWKASVPGASLASVYQTLVKAYGQRGYSGEHLKHHQGGPTGYLAREEVAGPESEHLLGQPEALAWNPSITGTKIEDTTLCLGAGRPEILTVDPEWPTFEAEHGRRPDYLVQA